LTVWVIGPDPGEVRRHDFVGVFLELASQLVAELSRPRIWVPRS
jgi:hypothetical protein